MAANTSSTHSHPGILSLDLGKELAESRQHKPWQSGLFSKLVLKAGDLRLVLIAMDAGAKMKEHHADGTISIHVLEGTICVHVLDEAKDMKTGQLLTLATGIKHDVEAREDSAFLLTISWPSSEELLAMKHRGYGS